MKNALILHGTDASPAANWFQWLQTELELLGYDVWLPQLPHADRPSAKTYNNFLLSNNKFEFNGETIIIGHSSGAVEVLSLLEHLDVKVKAGFMVSAFKDWLGWEALSDLFVPPLDFEKIKGKADNLIYVHSDNDPYCPLEHPQYLAMMTNGKVIIEPGQGHFNTELSSKYKQFPELLGIIRNHTA